MSAETVTSTNLVAQHYCGEFKLSNLNSLKGHYLRTPPFFPMPNINIKFCFEICYNHSLIRCTNCSAEPYFVLFKLRLLTLCATGLPPTMKLKLNVDLNFTDGSCLHRYNLLPSLTIAEKKLAVFDDLLITNSNETRETYAKRIYYLGNQLNNNHSFIIRCKMKFFNHIHTLPSYYKELRLSSHLKNFAKNFKSLQGFDEWHDISINIGEKSLPAHKAVLVAHSPVFRNMLTHNFKESTTNTITITDFSFEIFDCFLKYMYSGEIEDKSWPKAKELYALADKYDVSSLKQYSSEVIISQITLGEVCEILNLAVDYNDDKIKKEAMGFAASHIRELLPTKEWKELIERHPTVGYEAAINYIL